MNHSRRGGIGEGIFAVVAVIGMTALIWCGVLAIVQDHKTQLAWTAVMVPVNPATAAVGNAVYLGTEWNARRGVILSITPGGPEQPPRFRVRLPPSGTNDYTEATFLPTELWVHP